MKKSIGWVAIHKTAPSIMGGHIANKIYSSRGKAISCQKSTWAKPKQSTEDILNVWHILEAFVEIEDGTS